MKRILRYLNPIKRLGQRKYSFWFPFLASIILPLVSEFYAYSIAGDPKAVGAYIIFLHVAFIIYFSFRDGIKGGVITVFFAIAYYAYIIYTRNYSGDQLTRSIDTTIILGILYLALACVIGWLKQTIDTLLGREKDERRRLQSIISQLPVGVVVTDKDGYVVEVNKKIDAILGTKIPIGFKVGEREDILETTQNGKKVQPSQGPLAQVLATGKAIAGREMVIERKDGKHVFVQVSAAPIHNHEGKIIAAASISTDVTQQKELEKRKDDFVNMASHELKTPITSMKLYLEALTARLQTSDKSTQKIISRIKYQTENLQELVSDLLDVSKIQTGKLTFNKEDFSLNELIEEIIQDMQDASANHRISFRTKQKVSVHADRFRLYQVLTNLLTNAIKYSPEGGEIKVGLKRTDGKSVVSVQDFGIGIPKGQQKKIFDRLYQVTDPTEKTFPGLGMGLYISKEIMKRHKGSIWVESQKDKGSTFFIAIPVKQH
jgi:signal transduction histidine kinase